MFLFAVFINVPAMRESFPPHHTHTYVHTQSSAVFLPTAIIPLQDGQINYGFLDLETIIAARPPQWSLNVSWLPLPASLKRRVSGWHH